MKAFLKTTIVGGVLFLLPLAVLLFVLGHAMRYAMKVAGPVASSLHLDQMGKFEGAGAATIIAVLVLILVSFAAGLIARTSGGRRISRWFEGSVLSGVPQYQLAKSMAEGLAQVEGASGMKPALVSVEEGWQMGYLLEPVGKGWVAVFLPQAPTPMSGNVMYFPTKRVRELDITMVQAMALENTSVSVPARRFARPIYVFRKGFDGSSAGISPQRRSLAIVQVTTRFSAGSGVGGRPILV